MAYDIIAQGLAASASNRFSTKTFASEFSSVEEALAAAVARNKAVLVIDVASWTLSGNVSLAVLVEFVGKTAVSCSGFTLNFIRGFTAPDYVELFSPADGALITLPSWQRLTPFHFGARGDFVSSASPGTDDGAALNAWASELCWRAMPPARYGTTASVFWNGASLASSTDSMYRGLRAEQGAEIVQRTDNIPVFVFSGARGEWRFPSLSYANVQPSTNFGAVAGFIRPQPGRMGGFYMNKVSFYQVRGNAAVGFFSSKSISSTINANAAGGATSVTVTHAQTDHIGGYPWLPTMYVQIRLDDGTWFTTTITSVSGTTLNLAAALPNTTSPGRAIVANTADVLSGKATSGSSAVRFSNTWDLIYIYGPSRAGWIDTGNGTQDLISNIYIQSDPPSDKPNPARTLVSAIWQQFRNSDTFVIINVEHFKFTNDAIFMGSEPASLGTIHFEGCRLSANNIGFVGGTARNLKIERLKIVYCTMLSSDLTTSGGILRPSPPVETEIGLSAGIWNIGVLHTTKNIISPGSAFIVRDSSSNQTTVLIDAWEFFRDGGFYPSDQLTFPANFSGLTKIASLMPSDCVGFKFDADCNSIAFQRIFASNKGNYLVEKINVIHPSVSLTTATVGIYDSTQAILITTANNHALATLTDNTKVLPLPVASGEANSLRAANTGLNFKIATTQAKPSAVTGTSSFLTGRNGGHLNTNLGFVNFGAAHGFLIGQMVDISGSASAALNGRFKIVDIPSTTQIVVYVDSASAVGSSSSPVADIGITIQLVPTVTVFIRGADFPAFGAH